MTDFTIASVGGRVWETSDPKEARDYIEKINERMRGLGIEGITFDLQRKTTVITTGKWKKVD
jgi:hypothetical protein